MTGVRHLIVDGYNVIRMTPPYRDLVDRDDWELARETLVSDVSAYVRGDDRATVVFDGTGNPLSTGEPTFYLGVEIIFSPYGKTADSVIERISRLSSERGAQVVVVTSDAQTQWTVMGGNVVRRASREFSEHLEAEIGADSDEPFGRGSRVTLADQVSPAARKLLDDLRYGRSSGSADSDVAERGGGCG